MSTPEQDLPEPVADSPAGMEPEPPIERSPTSFFLGWVLVPLLVAAGLVASGVHQAAHNPDAWFTKAIRALSQLH